MKDFTQKVLSGFVRKIGFASFVLLFLGLAFASQASAAVVINEIYGGGGNASATYNQDFVELYNNGSSAVDLNGYSIQYLSAATGTGNYATCSITGSILPNSYFVIATSAVGMNGSNITSNFSCNFTIATSAGKVALVLGTTALSGTACLPTGTGDTIVDFVGYGTGTAICSEGSPAPGPSTNATSVQRVPNGVDTNQNSTDFKVLTPTPGSAGPTAAGATIGGRILSNTGRGIKNVRIMLTGDSLTEPIYATSTSFGYYQFPEVPSGETYILQVFSKNYKFNPSSMVVNLTEDLTEANFTGRIRGIELGGK